MTSQASFNSRLAHRAREVEARLSAQLDSRVGHGADRLCAAMRHAVLNGGKRFRPFLVIETASLFGMEDNVAMEAATAVEYIHCYSLVHDDLPCMDDDDLRRGQPTVHRAFDEATAILAGDALQTMAFEVLTTPQCHPSAAVRAELVQELAAASGLAGMAGGQMLDLEAETAPSDSVDIRRIQQLKTGALIRVAVTMGAIIGGAAAAERDALQNFAENLGLAFQISDDLLDVTGDAETVGKATGKDAHAGKATFVSRLGPEGAQRKLDDTEAAALDMLAHFDERADTLRAAVRFMSSRQN